MKVKEYDNVDAIRKSSDSEVKMLQWKHQLEQALKEKKRAEEELFTVKNKLREVLDEKIAMENELSHIQRIEDTRMTELEHKFFGLSEEYTKLVDENKTLKKWEHEMKKEM